MVVATSTPKGWRSISPQIRDPRLDDWDETGLCGQARQPVADRVAIADPAVLGPDQLSQRLARQYRATLIEGLGEGLIEPCKVAVVADGVFRRVRRPVAVETRPDERLRHRQGNGRRLWRGNGRRLWRGSGRRLWRGSGRRLWRGNGRRRRNFGGPSGGALALGRVQSLGDFARVPTVPRSVGQPRTAGRAGANVGANHAPAEGAVCGLFGARVPRRLDRRRILAPVRTAP